MSDLTVEVLKAIRGDLQGVRQELQGLRAETVQGFASVRGEIEGLKGGLTEVRVQLQELTEYTQAGFTAVLAQGDRRFLDHEGRLRRLEQHAGLEPSQR